MATVDRFIPKNRMPTGRKWSNASEPIKMRNRMPPTAVQRDESGWLVIHEPDSDASRLISRWCGTKERDLSFGAANFGTVYQIWQQSTTSAPEILHVTNFAAARPLEFMCYRNQIGPKPHRRSSQRQAYITGKIFCNFHVVGGTSCAIFIYFPPSQPAARADVFYSGGSDRHDDMNDMTKAMIPKPITHYETVGTISVDS